MLIIHILHSLKKNNAKRFCLPLLACMAFSANAQLYVGKSSSFITRGAVCVTLNNTGIINYGNVAATGSLFIFSGDSATQKSSISGSGTSFGSILITKTTNNVILNTGIAIQQNLVFKSGNLGLNNNSITLSDTAGTLVNETNASHITGDNGGEVIKNMVLNAPSSINPGNIGISITSSNNLGLTTIKRGHTIQNISPLQHAISRYFTINAANKLSVLTSLKFHYLSNEINGLTPSQLAMWQQADTSKSWSVNQKLGLDEVNNWLLASAGAATVRVTLASTQPGFKGLISNKPLTVTTVYPNPANRYVNIGINSVTANTLNVQLFNQQGRLLSVKKFSAVKGYNILQLNLLAYASGVYYAVINNTVSAEIVKVE